MANGEIAGIEEALVEAENSGKPVYIVKAGRVAGVLQSLSSSDQVRRFIEANPGIAEQYELASQVAQRGPSSPDGPDLAAPGFGVVELVDGFAILAQASGDADASD